MESKLSLHLIPQHGMDEATLATIHEMRPPMIKTLHYDPALLWSLHEAAPAARLGLRDWEMSEQKSDMIRDPEGTGRRHAREWAEKIEQIDYRWRREFGRPFAREQTYVASVNEPFVRNLQEIAIVVAYNKAMIEEAATYGLKVMALNLSAGWPYNLGPDLAPEWTPFEPVIEALAKYGGTLTVNEYWDVEGPLGRMWRWWAGRLLQCPYLGDVETLVGECGLDQFINNLPDAFPHVSDNVGWRAYLDEATYAGQLIDYDQAMSVVEDLLGLCIFTRDYGDRKWASFDYQGEVERRIVAYAVERRSSPAPRPPSPPAPPSPTGPSAQLAAALKAEFGERFVDLRGWLPRRGEAPRRSVAGIRSYVWHHGGPPTVRSTSWETVARDHVRVRGWPVVGYTLGLREISPGRVEVAMLNDVETMSYHAGDYNPAGLGICIMGDFSPGKLEPSPEELAAAQRLYRVLVSVLGEKPNVGHGDVMDDRSCPEQWRPLLGKIAEPAVNFRPIVWHVEEAARRLRAEGYEAEHDYLVAEVLPGLIAKRDATAVQSEERKVQSETAG